MNNGSKFVSQNYQVLPNKSLWFLLEVELPSTKCALIPKTAIPLLELRKNCGRIKELQENCRKISAAIFHFYKTIIAFTMGLMVFNIGTNLLPSLKNDI